MSSTARSHLDVLGCDGAGKPWASFQVDHLRYFITVQKLKHTSHLPQYVFVSVPEPECAKGIQCVFLSAVPPEGLVCAQNMIFEWMNLHQGKKYRDSRLLCFSLFCVFLSPLEGPVPPGTQKFPERISGPYRLLPLTHSTFQQTGS